MAGLDDILNKWEKETGVPILRVGGVIEDIPRIPFSSPTANYMTYGGIPRARATEFFGGEGGGKTTSALDICKNAQHIFQEEWEKDVADTKRKLEISTTEKKAKREINRLTEHLEELQGGPKRIVYLDLENTLDLEWAKKIGVDVDSPYFLIITPQSDSAERILQKLLDMIGTGQVGLAILDSIPCLVPQQIFDESIEKKMYAGASGPISVFCSKVPPYLTRTGCTLVMINQVREDLNNPYNDVVTPGGKALKHLYSVRIRARKGSLLDKDNKEIPNKSPRPYGNIVQLEVVKTKAFAPDRRLGSYTLNYYNGIDIVNDLATICLGLGVIQQAGTWFTLIDPQTGEIMQDEDEKDLKFQGMTKLREFLKEEPALCEELLEYIDKQ